MIFTKRKQKKIELVFIPGADERSREANRPTLPPSEVDVRIRFLAGGLGSAVKVWGWGCWLIWTMLSPGLMRLMWLILAGWGGPAGKRCTTSSDLTTSVTAGCKVTKDGALDTGIFCCRTTAAVAGLVLNRSAN